MKIGYVAVIKEPKSDCSDIQIDNRFRFYGYDLIVADNSLHFIAMDI